MWLKDRLASVTALGRIGRWVRHADRGPAADPTPDRERLDPMRDPITQAINSARGTAAQSLSRLLFADRDRWDVLRPTVEQLIVDPVLAVRAVAVECLIAILDNHRDQAIAGFGRLIDGADPILGSRSVERFVHFAMFREYATMRPILLRMLQSSEPATVQVGARQIALAGLSLDDGRTDTSLVLSLGEDSRTGAASVYADNLTDPTVGDECAERLAVLFHDESAAVRSAAARCWAALEPDELARRGPLLGAFVESIGPDVDVSRLIHRLGESRELLPAEVCGLAERVVSAYGPRGADPRLREAAAAYRLAPLIIRLHEETDDRELRRRVLDVIDEMLRTGFMGIGDQLKQRYAR